MSFQVVLLLSFFVSIGIGGDILLTESQERLLFADPCELPLFPPPDPRAQDVECWHTGKAFGFNAKKGRCEAYKSGGK